MRRKYEDTAWGNPMSARRNLDRTPDALDREIFLVVVILPDMDFIVVVKWLCKQSTNRSFQERERERDGGSLVELQRAVGLNYELGLKAWSEFMGAYDLRIWPSEF